MSAPMSPEERPRTFEELARVMEFACGSDWCRQNAELENLRHACCPACDSRLNGEDRLADRYPLDVYLLDDGGYRLGTGRCGCSPEKVFGVLMPLAAWDGATVLDALASFLRRFVVMSRSQADAVALWTIHTHALEAADATPYLAISSAEKRSGKSRLLEVLTLFVHIPLSTGNVSDAALFRSIADVEPTLLFDEVDAIFGPKARDREDLRALLNAGYRRGADVLRCVGEGSHQRVEHFPVFCPKALAGIGKLPDTVADRSIPIRLERRAPGERVERFRLRDVVSEAAELRERVGRWATGKLDALTDAQPELPEQLDDRAQDVCEPLLAIADLAGGEWPARARRSLVELYAGRALEDESSGTRLLADVRIVFGDEDRIASAELLERLHALEEAPWAEWAGKPLTTRGLAKLLRSYQTGEGGPIKSRNVRLPDGSVHRGFLRDQFEGAWSRYLPPKTLQRYNGLSRAENGGSESATEPPAVADRKQPEPAPRAECSAVADGEPNTGAGASEPDDGACPRCGDERVQPNRFGLSYCVACGWKGAA